MSARYVVALSLGPVSRFIAAGRSSRDLWFGSTWLSETTRRVAEHLQELPGTALLTPTAARLKKVRERFSGDSAYGGRVANKVLAVVTLDGGAPHAAALQALLDGARDVARTFLLGRLDAVRARFERWIDLPRFDAQREAIEAGDFLEFAAAWTALVGDSLGDATARAIALRGAALRGFTHASFSADGGERSDLDLGRDTVLLPVREGDTATEDDRRRHGLGKRTHLDAIGLTRRLWTFLPEPDEDDATFEKRPLPFVPTTRVAVDAWLAGVSRHRVGERGLAKLREVSEVLGDDRARAWATPARDPGPEGAPACFPYEASLLLDGGPEALVKEHEARSKGGDSEGPLKRACELVRRLHKECGAPVAYYAFVEMDGDGVGKLLAQADRARHAELIEALDTFADGIEVELRDRRATVIYAAGDELCFYLPVDAALDAIAVVAACFAPIDAEATLSAGLVLAHAKDDLRTVRAEARAALGRAKAHRTKRSQGAGSHLCVTELPRSGPARSVVGPLGALHESLVHWAGALTRGGVSLHTEGLLLEHVDRFGDDRSGLALLRQRILEQLARSGGPPDSTLTARVERITSAEHARELATELRLAARLVDVQTQRSAS